MPSPSNVPDTRGSDEVVRLSNTVAERLGLDEFERLVCVVPRLLDAYALGTEIGAEYARRPTRGEQINRRATLGARIAELRARLPDLEKQARKTPPKTLIAEKARVAAAKVALEWAQRELPLLAEEYDGLRAGGW